MLGISKWLNLLISMVIAASGEIWPLDRPENMPAINSLEVMCGKDHMDVHLSFSHPFEGIVSSKGQHGDPRCVYVPPSTGETFFSFRIAYTRCGTKPDMHGQFYENTVVVQYDKDLLEVWDEAKRLRCEWFNDYEKTASKPPMVIADLDVVQLDFRGDNVDCWMEIQHGKGPWASPVSGIVPLGSTLTLVVAINDFGGDFDMRVKSCVASDGRTHLIQLSDEFGCVLRPKMISHFLKTRGVDDRATVVTYAFFHAFKFPDALSVHIKCKVEICRRGCPGQCQPHGSSGYHLQDRNDDHVPSTYSHQITAASSRGDDAPLYDEILKNDAYLSSISGQKDDKSAPEAQAQMGHHLPALVSDMGEELTFPDPSPTTHEDPEEGEDEEFLQGPRNLKKVESAFTSIPASATPTRWKRTVRRSPRSDIGVNGVYEVISEADLAFSPDSHADAVTVFRGKIEEDVVYGICLPMPGLNALFVIVGLSAVLSALVAGAMLHRVQNTRTKRPEAIENTDTGLAFRMFGSRYSGKRGIQATRDRWNGVEERSD